MAGTTAAPPTLARATRRRLAPLVGGLLVLGIAAALALVMWPLARRGADDLAGLMLLSARSWAALPAPDRPALAATLRREHRLVLRAEPPAATPAAHWHGFYVHFLEQALARRLGEPVRLVALPGPDDGDWWWATLPTGDGGRIAVGIDHARLDTHPLLALGLLLTAGTLAVAGATAWLSRRIAAPVLALEQAAAALATGTHPQPLPETGPQEIARLAGHLNRLSAAVHELLAARTTLLAGVSHDLRTPLARMRLALEMLRLKPEPRLIDRLEQDVEAMNALIGQMLALARGLDSRPPGVLALAPWLAARAEGAGAAGGGPVSVACPPGLTVRADEALLARLVDNLLANARDHAPGPVDLVADAGPAAGAVTIEVRDRGPGIPEDQRDAVWRPFHRVDASRSPAGGGVGLGLAVVRQLAHSQGWTVALAPRDGGGLVARVVVPRAAPAAGPATAATQATSGPSAPA